MGIFDEAGIDLNSDIPSDPYGFGKDYWPVKLVAATPPDISKGGKQYGTMLKWKCIAPQYSYMESLGYGNWLQLPPPQYVVDTAPDLEFDKNSERGKKCIFALAKLFEGFGIPKDQWNSIEIKDLVDRECMAKIFVKQDDNNYWQFNITAHKPMPAEGSDGMDVFAGGNAGAASSNSGMSEMEKALAAEMGTDK